jgi:hypothetical protein
MVDFQTQMNGIKLQQAFARWSPLCRLEGDVKTFTNQSFGQLCLLLRS